MTSLRNAAISGLGYLAGRQTYGCCNGGSHARALGSGAYADVLSWSLILTRILNSCTLSRGNRNPFHPFYRRPSHPYVNSSDIRHPPSPTTSLHRTLTLLTASDSFSTAHHSAVQIPRSSSPVNTCSRRNNRCSAAAPCSISCHHRFDSPADCVLGWCCRMVEQAWLAVAYRHHHRFHHQD